MFRSSWNKGSTIFDLPLSPCSMIFYRTHLFQEERNIAVGLPFVEVIVLPVSDQGEATAVLRARGGRGQVLRARVGDDQVLMAEGGRGGAVSSWERPEEAAACSVGLRST